MSRKNKLRLAASCAAALLMSNSTYAQTSYSWNTAVDGNWTDAPNWTPNTGFPGALDSATFNAAGVNGPETIYLGSSETVSTITVANTATTSFFTGAAGTPVNNLPLTITNGGGITVNSGAGAVTIGTSDPNNNVQVVISGTGTITNNSSNLLTFDAGAGATTYSVLNDPTPPADDTLVLAGSGKIYFPSSLCKGTSSTPLALTMNMGSTGQVEFAGSGSTFAGGITLTSGLLGLKSSSALGQGTETLTINGGQIASISSARSIPASISLVFTGNGTFGATGAAPEGGTTTYVGGISFAGPVDLGGATRTISLVNVTTFSGAITNGGINKTGNGTLVLGNTGSTFSGPTIISAGTLSSTGSNDLSPNSSLILKSGTTFTANNGGFFSIGSLSDGGGVGGKITLGNVGGCALDIGYDNTDTTFSGQIQGNAPTGPTNFAGIVKVGTGTLTLTGSNIFNGRRNAISGGVLEVTNVGNGGVNGQMTSTSGTKTVTLVAADLPDGSSPNIAAGMTVDDGNLVPLATTIASVDGVANNGSTTTYNLTLSANATTTGANAVSNVGTPSGLGLAENQAGYLTLDGGTLQYWGTSATPASSDRLMTVTANGGGIDSSGAGPITFTGNTGTIFNPVPNAVVFTGTVGANPRTVTFSGTNTGNNTFVPVIGDAADPVGVTKTGAGKWILTGPNTYTGPTSVSAGTLVLTQSQITTSSVAITGGTLQLADVGTSQNVINTPTVSVAAGSLDLTNNKLIVSTTPIGGVTAGVYDGGSVQGMVQSGRNGGNWDGSGIVTSQTKAHGGAALTTLAVATAGDVGFGGTKTFAGQTVNGTDTLVMYTYAGDTNLDGQINGDDYFRVDQGYASAGGLTGYENGDLNYDGRIDADDYFIIDSNYGNQTLGVFPNAAPLGELAGGVSAVPEPASMMLLALSAAGLLPRRRRR